jgi:hypothetical protein
MKIILSIVSVVWTLLGAYLLSLSGGCDAQDASKVFQCLSANELGDFLAGFFAPLAFLWVAYAVIIQSQELAAQREELKLTRNELELTREVAIEAKDATRAQAEEARRSADYFSKQTEMMVDQHQSRVFQRAMELWIIRRDDFFARKQGLRIVLSTSRQMNLEPYTSGPLIEFASEKAFRSSLELLRDFQDPSMLLCPASSLEVVKATNTSATLCLSIWGELSSLDQERVAGEKAAMEEMNRCYQEFHKILKKLKIEVV